MEHVLLQNVFGMIWLCCKFG